MDSANALSALQGNSPNFAFDYSSAIGDESDDQGDLFAALLSQAQSTPPQPPPNLSNTQNPPAQQDAQQTLPSSPPAQPPQNNTAASAADDANSNANNSDNTGETNAAPGTGANNAAASSNSNAANNPAGANGAASANNAAASGQTDDSSNDQGDTNASPPATPQTTAPEPPVTGKSSRRESRTDGDSTNTDTHKASSDKSGQSPAVMAAVANQPAVNNIPATNQGGINSDPAPASGGTPAAAANIPLPADPGPAANADPASSGPATNSDPTVNAGLILNADPKTGGTTDPAGPGDDNATDPANNGVMPSHLMMLLMELEHLAAGQTSTQITPANLPVANGNAQTPATGSTQQTASSTGDQGKIDLKALMTEIARLDNGSANGDNIDPNSGGTANASQAGASSSSSAQTAQNTAPAWGNGSTGTDAKWISSDFLNLFSLQGNNPAANSNAPAASPILLNPDVITGAATGGNDGPALDADAQGQTNAGVRDNTVLPNNNSPLPALGSAQAASPYDFASQLSALRATQGGATGLPAPIDQVILQLSRNLASDGSSQMSIQLRPAELGRVDVKLTIGSDGKVQGTVTADNPSTLNLLLKDVRGLERALQEAGLRADSGSLQFGLRGDGQANGGSGQTAGNSSAFADDSVSSAGAGTVLPGFANPAETYYLTPGGVNMRV